MQQFSFFAIERKTRASNNQEVLSGKKFYFIQILLGAAFIFVAWLFFRARGPRSAFKVRESDRETENRTGGPDLAGARIQKKETLMLPGIRIDGPPHDVLGVKPSASADEVQRAYRDLMKRYHPDVIGPEGTRIAEALNRAKDELLRRRGGK